ncbi:MAG: MFS transporter [Syntrophomonadaceae bacterium]|nr:MFS transporter [Syntrophomonadaceae bacterium]
MMKLSGQIKTAFNNPFIPLRHKNFRYYWLGMCVSLTGTWMQNVAQPWLAYSLTKSAFLLGLVGALQFTPLLFFSLFAGVIVDRFSKKKILYITQSGSLIVTFILAVLVFTGHIRYWHILTLAFALGCMNTLDIPARQALVIQLVGKEDLMNAIALNSAMFNVARVAGPAVAGLVMGYLGVGMCFLINSISFAAVLISLFFIHPLPIPIKPWGNKRMLTDIKAGLDYIRHHRILRDCTILMAIIGTFAMNNNVLIPVFSETVLNLDEKGLGLLFSFSGIGALIGAMLVAAMSRSGPQKFVLYIVPFIISGFLILNSMTDNFLLAGFYLAATGLFFNLFSSTVNSTLQLNTKNEFRGRVMSVYIFVWSTPLGSLYAGLSADHWGAEFGFAACGAAIMVLLIPAYLYIRKGENETEWGQAGAINKPS